MVLPSIPGEGASLAEIATAAFKMMLIVERAQMIWERYPDYPISKMSKLMQIEASYS